MTDCITLTIPINLFISIAKPFFIIGMIALILVATGLFWHMAIDVGSPLVAFTAFLITIMAAISIFMIVTTNFPDQVKYVADWYSAIAPCIKIEWV